jgi:5-methylcytosine-specific restriction endonuclease McrA
MGRNKGADRMTFYEKEAAEEQKQRIYIEQHGRCASCGKPVKYSEAEAAHVIPKHKWLIKKYGKDVIHHRLNLRITHQGACNDKVMIMPESLPALDLIRMIQDDLNERD